jgi:6,7-dimethyl-8-ribityllumazine synthase
MMELNGSGTAAGYRFAIIVSRFNEEITEGLLQGARAALEAAHVRSEDITLVRVPGAFEIPVTVRRLADTGRFDAIVCLGCVIKGDTMHFEYIAESVAHGLAQVALQSGVPIALGVLTTLTEAQAVERAAPGPANKGAEAARAAMEMASLFRQLDEGPLA